MLQEAMLSLLATLLATTQCILTPTVLRQTAGSLMCVTATLHRTRGLWRLSSHMKTCSITCSRLSLLPRSGHLQDL